MNILSKVSTLGRLVRSGAWSTIRLRLLMLIAGWRLRLHEGKPFVNRDLGFRAVCHPDWPESRTQFLGSVGDRFEFTIIRKWLHPGDWFVDAGANKGLFSFAALSAIGRTGGVLAIDADEFACQKFKSAVALLGAENASALHAALTDAVGSITFYVSERHTGSEMQSIHPTEGALRDGMQAVTVPTVDLRTVAARDLRGVDPVLIKMDIEGAETAALRGVPGHWLSVDGPLWMVEVNPGCLPAFGSSARELCDLFRPEDFDRWLLPKHPVTATASTAIRRLTDAETFQDSAYYNLLAVPRGQRWRDRRLSVSDYLPLQA